MLYISTSLYVLLQSVFPSVDQDPVLCQNSWTCRNSFITCW